jgi:hypothetical protein
MISQCDNVKDQGRVAERASFLSFPPTLSKAWLIHEPPCSPEKCGPKDLEWPMKADRSKVIDDNVMVQCQGEKRGLSKIGLVPHITNHWCAYF